MLCYIFRKTVKNTPLSRQSNLNDYLQPFVNTKTVANNDNIIIQQSSYEIKEQNATSIIWIF